jgi:hypothetical protein
MSKIRFTGLAAALVAVITFTGCSSTGEQEITGYSVRMKPTPEMEGVGYTPEQRQNAIVRTWNTNLRQIVDDWDRFWLLDQPLHFSPYSIP